MVSCGCLYVEPCGTCCRALQHNHIGLHPTGGRGQPDGSLDQREHACGYIRTVRLKQVSMCSVQVVYAGLQGGLKSRCVSVPVRTMKKALALLRPFSLPMLPKSLVSSLSVYLSSLAETWTRAGLRTGLWSVNAVDALCWMHVCWVHRALIGLQASSYLALQFVELIIHLALHLGRASMNPRHLGVASVGCETEARRRLDGGKGPDAEVLQVR